MLDCVVPPRVCVNSDRVVVVFVVISVHQLRLAKTKRKTKKKKKCANGPKRESEKQQAFFVVVVVVIVVHRV